MDIFPQIIQMLTKEEVRHFKLFSQRTLIGETRKDLELFDFVRKSGEAYEEEKIFEKLYETVDKNSFYRLKNRLLSDVNKSIILQHTDSDESLNIFHLLSLGRFYRNRNQFKIAQYYIRKAEKKAISIENYELLDFIYSELITLSHEIVSINPEDYIRRRKENREKLNQLRQIEDILAAVKFRLKVTQNFSSSPTPIFDMLEKTVEDFSDNPSLKESPKLRFTLYQAVSSILLSRHDYISLEDYLLRTYKAFNQEGLFNKANHDTKLQMITYLVNTLYRNKKTEESLRYCHLLSEGMEEYGRMLFKKYLFFYYNGLVINYTRRQEYDKSIAKLEDAMKGSLFKEMPFYECLTIFNLSVSYFNLKKFTKAMKALVQASIHDGFKNFEAAFKLQVGIYELMLRLELGDQETLKRRLEKVRKEFESLLSSEGYERDLDMVNLLEKMADSPQPERDKALQKNIKDFLKLMVHSDIQDTNVINYTNWLSGKLNPSFNT